MTASPDFVSAVVAYLQGAMGQSLASSTGYAQVYLDYAPSQNPDGSAVAYPYAIVTEGSESYTAQSENVAVTGYYLSNIASGSLFVSFASDSKATARTLGRTAVRLITDSEAMPVGLDGRTITLFPQRADTVIHRESGIGTPTHYERVVTVNYMQQFLE